MLNVKKFINFTFLLNISYSNFHYDRIKQITPIIKNSIGVNKYFFITLHDVRFSNVNKTRSVLLASLIYKREEKKKMLPEYIWNDKKNTEKSDNVEEKLIMIYAWRSPFDLNRIFFFSAAPGFRLEKLRPDKCLKLMFRSWGMWDGVRHPRKKLLFDYSIMCEF